MKAASDSPVFIVGVARSGTTLIRLMLHSHPRIAVPYETHFITDYHGKVAYYGDLRDPANRERLVRDILAEPLTQMWDHAWDVDSIVGLSSESADLAGVLHHIYDQYAKGKGKQRWGDKSDYIEGLPVIHSLFPEAQFIHIVRDGRDVASSALRMDWGPKDLIEAANWWYDQVRLCRRMGAVLGPEKYTEVRYEDLVTRPEEELRRLCDFLGEEFAPEMLEYHVATEESIPEERKGQHYNTDRPPRTSRVFAWKREMNPVDVAIFQRFAIGMIDELGYEVSDKNVGRFRTALRMAQLGATKLLSSDDYRRDWN